MCMVKLSHLMALALGVLIVMGYEPVAARAGGGLPNGRYDVTSVRETIIDREQQAIIAPDDEWAIIAPKLWRVITLQAIVGMTNPPADTVRRALYQNSADVEMTRDVAAVYIEICQHRNDLQNVVNGATVELS